MVYLNHFPAPRLYLHCQIVVMKIPATTTVELLALAHCTTFYVHFHCQTIAAKVAVLALDHW
jgi:hypothetical protein